MATPKWKNDNIWETFYYGALENIKADLRNISVAINNLAAAIRRRCCRDKNLSDVYSAEESRKNLGLIGDCSDESKMGISPHYHDSHHLVRKKNLSDVYDAAESRINLKLINDCSALPKASHHHDSRYVPLIEKEAQDRKNADDNLKSRVNGLLNRLRGMRQCNCGSGDDDPPIVIDDGGTTSGAFIGEFNYNNMFESSYDEDTVWKHSDSYDLQSPSKVRVEMTAQIRGNGSIDVAINGQRDRALFKTDQVPGNSPLGSSYAGTPQTVTHTYGPFQLNKGNNTWSFGLDGNNPMGIELISANLKLYTV